MLAVNVMDSVEICEGESLRVHLYDSIGNPAANPNCLTGQGFSVFTDWVITPTANFIEVCETFGEISPTTTGTFNYTATLIRATICESDTHTVSGTVFIQVNPAPTIQPFILTITGSQFFCPGDSTMLVVTGSPDSTYSWSGPGVNGSTADTIFPSVAGNYLVTSSISDTNSFGCTASFSTSLLRTVQVKPQPTVSASSTLICPNDSVLLSASNVSPGPNNSFSWEGPNGPIPTNAGQIWVSDPGLYFVLVNDDDSCGLVSNSILLSQYTTPTIGIIGDPILCPDDSVFLSVVTTDLAVIEMAPSIDG